MKPLPRFIYANGKELGAGLVIQTLDPPILARIIQYKSYFEMISQLNSKPPVAYSTITGYCIALIYEGVLGRGYRLIGGDLRPVQQVLDDMAVWYREERIEPHLGSYKRYLI